MLALHAIEPIAVRPKAVVLYREFPLRGLGGSTVVFVKIAGHELAHLCRLPGAVPPGRLVPLFGQFLSQLAQAWTLVARLEKVLAVFARSE